MLTPKQLTDVIEVVGLRGVDGLIEALHRTNTSASGRSGLSPNQQKFLADARQSSGPEALVPSTAVGALADAIAAENDQLSASESIDRANTVLQSALTRRAQRLATHPTQ